MSLAELIPLAINVSMGIVVFSLGLRTNVRDSMMLARQPELLLRSLLSMNVVMPAFAVALVASAPLEPAVKIAIVALALSPVPPILPRQQKKAGGTGSYTIALLATAAALAIVIVPAGIYVVGRVLDVTIEVPGRIVAPVLLITVIAPLVAGTAVHAMAPDFARRFAHGFAIAGTALLVVAFLPVVVVDMPMILEVVGNGTLLALALFTIVGVAIGHLLGGPDPDDRTVLALATGARHPGVALAIATATFPAERAVFAVVLWHLVLGALVARPYIGWRRRAHREQADRQQNATGARASLEHDPPRAWKDGAVKHATVDLVGRPTRAGEREFIPPSVVRHHGREHEGRLTHGLFEPERIAMVKPTQRRQQRARDATAIDRRDAARRSILPMPDEKHVGLTTYDARDPDTKYPPITALRPPRGAPNVLIVLIDDVGFGASSAFGGPCETPTAERLASAGLRYNRFHTTALCSPTRQALLTGRNHHSVGMGAVTEMATSAPGNSSIRPKDKAPLAEILKLNGYSTAQFGKCHEVPQWEVSPVGPFHQWPTGSGFEHFYGFVGGEANQYYPGLYEGTKSVEPPRTPEEGYTLTEDLADRAIRWVRQQKALMPDKPFFMYFAPGATHAPHHVPREWSDRYRGRFDGGWDALREATFARQKELGVIPEDAELTVRHDEIPGWDEMPAALRPVLARQMEIYAGFLTQVDHHVGRLIDTLEQLGVLDDTLVYYIIGDNGASAEGTLNGCFNEMTTLNGMPGIESVDFLLARIDDFGTPAAYNHYAVGWAHALCAPYQWTKQIASHWGGTRNGTIVHWPNGVVGKGEIRSQFHHVIDVARTILEVARLPEPTMVNGIAQAPFEGVSMADSFVDGGAPDVHSIQYFEMFGNRGIYHDGWTAVTKHRTPWTADQPRPFDEDVWELYGPADWTQARNIAADNAAKLAELQRLWLIEATKYNVLPLDDRSYERINPDIAGRPQLVRGDTQMLFSGMRVSESSILTVKNKSHTVTAQVTVPENGAEGVLITQGGSVGGWSLYVKAGMLKYCYNFFGIEHFFIEASKPVPKGCHQVRMEFRYDGGGLAKGGDVTLYYDGELVGQGRVERTIPMAYSADEACDVGSDSGSPTSPDYGPSGNKFNGEIAWVQIDLGEDSHDHLVPPEDRFRIAMAKQ